MLDLDVDTCVDDLMELISGFRGRAEVAGTPEIVAVAPSYAVVRECQGIVNEDRLRGLTFCGKPTVNARSSYCADCRKRVLTTGRPHRGSSWAMPRNQAA